MDRRSVSVQIRGREFRIRSADDEESLRRVARHLDETMARVEQKTGTVDSLGVALLTALNLAREVMELRAAGQPEGDPERLRELIELAEAALGDAPARA
jgi:cell division protein ZapA (FtsZ GTPase activity inhibitor)